MADRSQPTQGDGTVEAGPAGPAKPEPLLRAEGLTRHFRVGGMFSKEVLHAVDDLDLTINEREIVALVGESGSGKSTVARLAGAHLRADRRRDLLPRAPGAGAALASRRALVPGRGRDGLPGSVQRLQSRSTGCPTGSSATLPCTSAN